MNNKVKIKSDNKLNNELKDEVQTLRGMINTGEPSERFGRTYHPDLPKMIVLDRETGKSVEVSLCDASGVMKALSELFE